MPSWNENYVVTVHNVRHIRHYRRLHLTANAVALYCLAKLFADGKANLAVLYVRFVVGAVQHDEALVRNAASVLVHVVVLIVFFKSVNRLQSLTFYAERV